MGIKDKIESIRNDIPYDAFEGNPNFLWRCIDAIVESIDELEKDKYE